MFGLKGDWSLDVKERYFTLEDYCGAEPRWCTGCGDHGILAAVHRVCRDAQLKPEKTVAVSGIGCSSRLPHYMNTYGFHGLHGRALPVACGIKSRRPDLDVWVATGDGDSLSIGGNHLMHALRRNVGLKILLFNNEIYGLTKGQYSPTSRVGTRSPSSPTGSVDAPVSPGQFALGAGAKFFARAIDTDKKGMTDVLEQARAFGGTSLTEIFQNCIVYNEDVFASFTDRKTARARSSICATASRCCSARTTAKAFVSIRRPSRSKSSMRTTRPTKCWSTTKAMPS